MFHLELKNLLELKGDWNVFKGRVRQFIGRFTDNDRQCVRGLEDELIGRIQKRTGATRRALTHIVTTRRCRQNVLEKIPLSQNGRKLRA